MLRERIGKILLCVLTVTAVSAQEKQTLKGGASPHLFSPISTEIQEIEERVLNFKNPETSALVLSHLADLLWKLNPHHSRDLFSISLKKLSVTLPDSANGKSSGLSSYRKVVSLIARHDRVWANALLESLNESTARKANSSLEVADALLESDPKLASDFAQQSLQHDVTRGFVSFLMRLRQQNQVEADRLFMQAVFRYSQLLKPSATNFAILGTYLFSSPQSGAGNAQTITFTRVGNVFVPNVAVNHPNIPVNLVHSYLRTAVLIISSPTSDPEERSIRYALGHQLLPKAREFVPNLVGELSGALAALISHVPAEITNEEAYKNLDDNSRRSFDERISDIDKKADVSTRDRLFLDLAYHSWQRNDFPSASTAAARIENEDVREALDPLILFGQGTRFLKGSETDLIEAMHIADRLRNSFEKCLLGLGIASAAEKSRQEMFADQAFTSSLASARKLNDKTTPFLIMYVSGQLKKRDLPHSSEILAEAIREFNKFDTLEPPVFVREIRLDPLKYQFSIRIDGVDLNFRNSLQRALPENIKDSMSIVSELNDEKLKGEGYLLVAKRIIENKTVVQSAKSQDIVIRVGEDGIRKSASKIVLPTYPKESEKKRMNGVAVAEIQYNGNGDVTEVKVLSSPDSATGESIKDAMVKWKFKPSKLDSKPISIRGKITFYFVIDSKGKGKVENPKQFQ